MQVNYSTFDLTMVLDSEINFSTMPEFIFRSIIGNELRQLNCLFKTKKCEECSLRFQCAYSIIFESPIEKESNVLQGRNYASHPFLLRKINCKEREIVLRLTLIGKAVDYFPYIFYAITKGGESGLFKERIKYLITSVKSAGVELLTEKGEIKAGEKLLFAIGNLSEKNEEMEALIKFMTPCRLKINGRYTTDFTPLDLIKSIERRLETLSSLYGAQPELKQEKTDKEIVHKDLKWIDIDRYSARQKTEMKLGGFVGEVKIKGLFSQYESALLKGAELFHVGKNASFGLGQIEVWMK